MSPIPYVNMIEGKREESRFALRLELVRYAERHGIRESARVFRCSRNTVRLWRRRYEAEGLRGLQERSRAPKHIPHKTSVAEERAVVAARKKVPCYGAARLKYMFALRPSVGAISRILRAHQLTKKPRKKHEKKRDLRAVKARYHALTRVQVDVKYLNDIPHYWTQIKRRGLPGYEYTLRCPKTGALFVSFAQEISLACAELFCVRYVKHLEQHGFALGDVQIQTDWGGEFGGTQRQTTGRGFVHTLEDVLGAKHRYIPPSCPNANADVETVHNLVEQEFFDLEHFGSLDELLEKAALYQHYFNYVRPNSYKGWRTPWQILQDERADLPPTVLRLDPVLLDSLLRGWLPGPDAVPVGHGVPVDPASRGRPSCRVRRGLIDLLRL